MSKKSELLNVLSTYKAAYEGIQKAITDINQSMSYTGSGKEEATGRILLDFEPNVKIYHDKAVTLIDSGLEALAAKWKQDSAGKLFDGGYQAGLANVIRMLEMGVIKDRDDIKNIIDTYRGDFNALAVIKGILSQSINETVLDCIVMIPKDMREDNKRLLNQLKGNVEHDINSSAIKNALNASYGLNQGLGSLSLGLDGSIQFITDRLGDNLELIAQN